MPTYAIASDYAEYKGVADDYSAEERARINAGLLSAQDDVQGQILFSVYDYADEATATALKRATCARFDYMETSGDDGTGTFGLFDSIAIGSVRLAKNSSAAAAEAADRDPLAEALGVKAAQILRNAGLISGVVAHT